MSSKICKFCGREYKTRGKSFCNKECEGKFRTKYKIKQGGPIKTMLDRVCLCCGKTFSPVHSTNKYCSKTCAGKYRYHNLEDKCFIDKRPKERSIEHRRKLSINMAERMKNTSCKTKGVGGIREDIGHYVRSRWEANICRILKENNVIYEYEPDVFHLIKEDGSTISYIPDIKISSNYYVEVKGWETEKSKIKTKLMREQNPDIFILRIEEKEYKYLLKTFSSKIDKWEFDKRHGR